MISLLYNNVVAQIGESIDCSSSVFSNGARYENATHYRNPRG